MNLAMPKAEIDFAELTEELLSGAELDETCRFETRGTARMRACQELPVMIPRAKRLSGWRVLAALGVATPVLLGIGCGILAHAQAEAVRRQQELLAAPITRHTVVRASQRPISARPAPVIETLPAEIEVAAPALHARSGRAAPRPVTAGSSSAEAATPPASATPAASPAPADTTAPLPQALSPLVIQKTLAGVRERVRACRSKLPAAATVVNAEVVIGRNGAVSEVGVDGLGADDPEAAHCLEQAISEAQFPPFAGEPRIVRYPYTLK